MEVICVASTVAAYKCAGDAPLRWLSTAEELVRQSPEPVHFFLAAQIGQGRDAEINPLLERMAALNGTVWRFSVDEGATEVNSGNRLVGICTGRNLAHEFVTRDPQFSHLLLLDSDLQPPTDTIPLLLEVDHPVVGGDVREYCLSGPRLHCRNGCTNTDCRVDCVPLPFHVEEHWNTAGFLLLQRNVVRQIRWRWDPNGGPGEGPLGQLTDDPCFAQDAEALGFGRTWVRKDVVGKHDTLVPLDARGHDLRIQTGVAG